MATKMKLYAGKIPFRKTSLFAKGDRFHEAAGSLLHHAGSETDENIEWRENVPLKLSLIFKGFSRGRSSVTADCVDSSGRMYPVSLHDFEGIMLGGGVQEDCRILTKTWAFKKQGQNYFCIPYDA